MIALLPGSRKNEIRYIAPPLIAAARRLAAGRRFVLPVAPGLRPLVEPLVVMHPSSSSMASRTPCWRPHDLTLVASGTAALEAALSSDRW